MMTIINQGVNIFSIVALLSMPYKDEPLIDDRHHLKTPQQNHGSVEPKVAVQYSRPYFFPSQCKRKNSGLATRD